MHPRDQFPVSPAIEGSLHAILIRERRDQANRRRAVAERMVAAIGRSVDDVIDVVLEVVEERFGVAIACDWRPGTTFGRQAEAARVSKNSAAA
jgi:hypothetical protein